jgi:exoribonuclease R
LLQALDGISRHDPHEWIERLMVEYNCRVAGVLRHAGVGILRSHKGTSSSEYEALAAKTGLAELAHFGKAAGVYCRSTDADVAHAGLGLAEYCHASSPIRRYVDLVNQRWIKHLLFDAPKPATPVSLLHLHRRARVAKQMEADLWFRSHIAYDRVTEARGIVIEHKQDTRYAVYVPEWKKKLTGVSPVTLEPGCAVVVSIFLDKANPRWYDRIICSLACL